MNVHLKKLLVFKKEVFKKIEGYFRSSKIALIILMQNLYFWKKKSKKPINENKIFCVIPQICLKTLFFDKESNEHVFIPYELKPFDEGVFVGSGHMCRNQLKVFDQSDTETIEYNYMWRTVTFI